MRESMMLRVAPYSQLAATYDRALGIQSFVRTKRAFELVVRRYRLCFGLAADVGCGTGLFACYLGRCWGTRVLAVDRSREMLRVAACRCRDPNVRFLRQDIRCLRLPYPVDLVTANFDTVNHLLTAADLGLAFRRIAENLRPGGHFVFDVITRAQPSMRPVAYMRRLHARGRALFQRVRWDPRRGLLSILIFHRWPQPLPPSVELHVERAYSPAEVGRLLFEAGFVIRGVLDAVSLRAPSACPPRLLIVARKDGASR
jgi:SAM-dependent methyltransferase